MLSILIGPLTNIS